MTQDTAHLQSEFGIDPPKQPGRPSQYTEAILRTAENYLLTFEEQGDVVPTAEGLADVLGKGTKTLYNWANEFPEFQAVMDRLMAKQGRLLQSKGLKKETDSGITKLLLSANHNKAERTESDQKIRAEVSLSAADKVIAEVESRLTQ